MSQQAIKWDELATEYKRAATVDWPKFESMVKGKICTFEQAKKAFVACGGVSSANLRRKIYAYRKDKKVAIRYLLKGQKTYVIVRFDL